MDAPEAVSESFWNVIENLTLEGRSLTHLSVQSNTVSVTLPDRIRISLGANFIRNRENVMGYFAKQMNSGVGYQGPHWKVFVGGKAVLLLQSDNFC